MKNMIGNTPLLKITYKYKGEERTMYAKAEFFNLTGSIKDRMAKYIIEKSYEDGTLQKGQPIIEATSGNTGIAFSALGALYHHPVHIFMPEWMSDERKRMIKKYGATLHEVTHKQGGFEGSVVLADQLAKDIDGFRPQQFVNKYNADAHYKTTGPEIIAQINKYNIIPDGFVVGIGTGGTMMGTGKKLREFNPKIKLFPLEPFGSQAMSMMTSCSEHRIQGIGDGFVPELMDLDFMDEVIAVHDGDSILMAQKFSKEAGLGVGISSGANFIGAVLMQNKYGKDFNIVTVFSDDSKKYLSTDLLKDEPVQNDYITPDIEIIDVVGECVCDKLIQTFSC